VPLRNYSLTQSNKLTLNDYFNTLQSNYRTDSSRWRPCRARMLSTDDRSRRVVDMKVWQTTSCTASRGTAGGGRRCRQKKAAECTPEDVLQDATTDERPDAAPVHAVPDKTRCSTPSGDQLVADNHTVSNNH